jgi:hypothetical protein
VPAAICVVYAVTLGIGNSDKIGFPAGSLMFFAVLSMATAVIAAVRIVSDARR